MRERSAQRRRLAGVAASVSAMSGVGPGLLRNHPRIEWVWLGVMISALIWVIVALTKLNCKERRA